MISHPIYLDTDTPVFKIRALECPNVISSISPHVRVLTPDRLETVMTRFLDKTRKIIETTLSEPRISVPGGGAPGLPLARTAET